MQVISAFNLLKHLCYKFIYENREQIIFQNSSEMSLLSEFKCTLNSTVVCETQYLLKRHEYKMLTF